MSIPVSRRPWVGAPRRTPVVRPAATMRSLIVVVLVASGLLLTGGPTAAAAPVGTQPPGVTGGQVVAWGANTLGQTTVPPAARSGVVAVAAGYTHNLALTSAGSVIAWGSDFFGQAAVPASAGTDVVSITAGVYHNLALKADGSVIAWGRNNDGQSNVPLAATSGVTAIAAGLTHSVALTSAGDVVGWGDVYAAAVPQHAATGATAVAAGSYHSLALRTDGSVVAWGDDSYGQSTVPAAVASGVVAIAASMDHSLALKGDGSVVAWGDDFSGQSTVPAAAMSGVVAIAAGQSHSLALRADGTVVTWGRNNVGQSTVPAAAASGVLAIAGGYAHSLALVERSPDLTADNPPAAVTVGQPYTYTFAATGAPAPVFSVSSGSLPAGLSLNPTTGALSGTATTAGAATFTVTAANGITPPAVSSSHTITVSPAVALDADAPPLQAPKGDPYSYTFTATNTVTPAFTHQGVLPPGLTLDGSTGVLSGTPTTTGAYSFSVVLDGTVIGAPHLLTVTEPVQLVNDAPPTTAPLGVPWTYTFTATGYPAPTFTVSTGALPSGLVLDSSTGVLSGTPTTTGASTFTVSAGTVSGAAHTVTVTAEPTLTADAPPAIAPVGTPYGYTFTATGFPSPQFTVSSGALPADLTLNAASGALTGTPTASGTYNYVVTAANGVGAGVVGTSHTLTVTATPVFTADTPPTAATLGVAYTYAFNATGYPTPSFSVASGTLPNGLALDTGTGVLSGTPTAPGSSTFSVRASNGLTADTTGATHTITVTAPPTAATSVLATGERGYVAASWTAPVGGGPINHYLVTASPGDASCTTTATSCILGGTIGQSYQVTVTPVGPTGLPGPAATATSTVVSAPVPENAPPAGALPTLTTTEGALSKAEVGQRITIIGSGFLPYSTATITIYSTPTPIGHAVTDAGGNFSTTITVPSGLAVGQHTLVAAGIAPDGSAYAVSMAVSVAGAASHSGPTAGGVTRAHGLADTGSGALVPIAVTGLTVLAAGVVLLLVVKRGRTT